MSGGLFNYKNEYLKNEIFDWCDGKKVPNVFEDREISELIYDVFELIHCFDLYKSGDTCKGTYLHQKNEFKIKWMGNRGVRVKRIVDAAISDVKQELYETYDIKQEDEESTEELRSMCERCEQYCGKAHAYDECRDMPCFKFWLGWEYLNWMNAFS